jgi:hypothetical protein
MAIATQIATRLEEFDFDGLFNQLGWLSPIDRLPRAIEVDGTEFLRKQVAHLSGVVVFEITSPDGKIPDRNTRRRVHTVISKLVHENVLIFVDTDRTQSLWLWVKREKGKTELREHDYFRGQPVDLMLSKLVRINFELTDFDDEGNPPPIVEVARRLQHSLDIEKVTKKFYGEFQTQHIEFLKHIHGISDERDKRWYASVILNRLMFVYFLQRKSFVDNDDEYLQKKLARSKSKGKDLYFKDFLWKLFFVGFAKPAEDRDAEERQLLGDVPYLNGGLFLPHKIELDDRYEIRIDDSAFDNVFKLFEGYSWNLDDTPGGKPDEINPDVLGYIFEKYINQKAFGAYYTRPEITQYLCEQTIYKLILDRINSLAEPANQQQLGLYSTNEGKLFLQRTYDSMADLLLNLDAYLCEKLWFDILPSLKILDPACGSGAFLVAALKTLLNVYSAVIGKMETLGDKRLKGELDRIRSEHKSLNYDIKKRIITNNLFGVDLMEEATEIAKLRLFMTLVSSVHHKNELEPLPNIDFNILAGNSLIGILKVDEMSFDKLTVGDQPSLLSAELSRNYKQILEDKSKSIEQYKNQTFDKSEVGGFLDQNTRLLQLREHIEKIRKDSYEKLNQLLLGDFNDFKIKFEQATWDEEKKKDGKPKKRDLLIEDIEALHPFHWGYEFDEILNSNGGFDAIITNPPWETFKPQSKEFFAEYSDLVSANKMNIKDFEKKKAELLENRDIQAAWLAFQSRFPYVSSYYRQADQYENQISVVNGKKQGTDINLYKLFTEQCFNLLGKGGRCGIIIQSGIYTDLGTKQLRVMLFEQCQIQSMFGFSNERFLFENVHHAQKFCILVFEKGGDTSEFDAAFRINPREAVGKDLLEQFLNSADHHIRIPVSLIRQLSPDALAVMEFKGDTDVRISKKLLRIPFLSESLDQPWTISLCQELHMTNDSYLFELAPASGRSPLIQGGMFHQFNHDFAQPKYWIDINAGRKNILGRTSDNGQLLAYEKYRFVHRRIASATNERSAIACVLPPNHFCADTAQTVRNLVSESTTLYFTALFNSFVVDWEIRQRITSHLDMHFVYSMRIPRLTESDLAFNPIVERAAKLICTTSEFDDLAAEVSLGSHKNGVTDPIERQKLRAELDAIIAHLYGLTDEEFAYILTTFPLVSEDIKQATLVAFRTIEQWNGH